MAAKGYASDLNDAQWALIERHIPPARSGTPPAAGGHPRGRQRHLLSAPNRVAGLLPLWPTIHTVIADAGHQSRKLAAEIKRQEGWRLVIVKRSEPAFKILGLNWIVERTFGWLGRHRRLSKDYEFKVQTSDSDRDRCRPDNAKPARASLNFPHTLLDQRI